MTKRAAPSDEQAETAEATTTAAAAPTPAPEAKRQAGAKGPDGEVYWQLTAERRVTVRKFKGKTYIDVREFYQQGGAGGELKPGKKGISLTPEQWAVLKQNIADIDAAVASMK
jgi:hypothetical protein